MTDWQRNQHIADIGDPQQGGLAVHAARWPGYPGGKPSQVMWARGDRWEYLSPQSARWFAAALVKAADEVEAQP